MNPTLDGSLADWTAADRLETPATAVAGYELYGRLSEDIFFFALRAPVAIGANTTFWLNTDNSINTGYKVWGFASGAEFNVNFGADGVPRLYTGADGQTLVTTLTYARSADGRIVELALPRSVLGASVQTVDIHADINNSVFLPADFTLPGYRIAQAVNVPPSSFDGVLSEWTATQRLDNAANAVAGFEIFGKVESESFVFGVKSPVAIGANTTFWLNTDGQTSTGHQIWGWAGGAEFNVNIGADGVARLYSGAEGQTLVGNIDYAIAPDGLSIEFAVPRSLIGASVASVTMLADINNSIFVPGSYGTQPGYALTDTSGLPPSTFDGLLNEWTAGQRLDSAANQMAGYEIYGRAEPDRYVFAMKSAVAIGPNTTFWLNTDDNPATGHQIWGFAGGAEYNINIGADGIARLYSGDAGQVLVGTIDYALSPDKLSIEFAVTKAQVGNAASVTMVADVNDTVFLPSSYATMPGFRLQGVTASHDGLLTEWTAADRLETPLTATPGYELYGKYAGGQFTFALKSDVAIGPNTTFWFNTDNDPNTGYRIFGSAGGAEYNVNIGADGVARLYTGAAGETLVGPVDYRLGPDGKTMEFSVAASAMGGPSKVGVLADVNDSVFLPGDYTRPQFTVQDPATLVQPAYDGQKIAIVYSATTAGAFFSEMAYSQLIMAAQSQAMAAGIPYDLISESDLTNINLLVNYDAIVFPSFRNAPANYAEIASTLQQLVYDHNKPLITAGDFMTNDAAGAALPGNPYERMESLLGIHRTGGESGVSVQVVASGTGHPITEGYGDGGSIYAYGNTATSYFEAFNPGYGEVTTIATQVVNGASHNAVLGSTTGGRNVSFATEAFLADSNLLGRAIDWVTASTGPQVSLMMSRHSEIVASRNDMDQSQETFDVDGGIYDALLPILEQWKAQYGFVGSYYVNVGLNPPDQETNWTISGPYYERLLAMGNEIGSHSYTHPHDTNQLLPAAVTQAMIDAIPALNGMSLATFSSTLEAALAASDPSTLDAMSKAVLEATFQFQFDASRTLIAQQLGIDVTGAAVPGMPENIATAREIMQYYSGYVSGGASMIGAGYPGAMGYLSPTDQGAVYIAPNMSFDFTLTDWLGLTPEQAILKWEQELGTLRINSDLPIIVWPWHDYGATQWPLDEGVPSKTTLEMFTSVIAAAHGAGAEFVTLQDLSQRIRAFEQTDFGYTVNGDLITVKALPTTGGLGTFALDLDDLAGKSVARVNGWYAYDEDSVFLDGDGGTYEIVLGAAADDVTHITRLGQRAKLESLTGDGENLTFTVTGEGDITVSLKLTDGHGYQVTGATIANLVGDVMTLRLAGIGTHNVTVQSVPMVNNPASDITIANLAAVTENTATRLKIADLTVIDNDPFPTLRNNVVTVDDPRFEIDSVDGGLYLRPGQIVDFETGQTISVTLTATDGTLVFTKPLVITVVNANDAPTGEVAIAGTPTVGQVLSASTAPLSDQDGIGTLSYQWQRHVAGSFVAIAGANTATYALAAQDIATAIRVVVSYTDNGGALETVTSAATAPVSPASVAMAASTEDQIRVITAAELTGGAGGTVSNLVASSGTLTANPDGTWYFVPALNDDTAVTFTYQVTTGGVNVTGMATLDLLGMTDVMGTASANTLAGRATADQYHGGAGNDTISGGGGDDILFGDAGADRVNGDNGNDLIVATTGDGNDIYNGGAGVDTYDFSRTSAAAVVRLDTGTASSSQTGSDTLSNIENVIGGSGNDTITGSSAANSLWGGFGNDTLNGGGGADMLDGGWGSDRLSGGAGRDVLVGGSGNDTFIFAATSDSAANAAGRDFITDFTKGQDRIDLSAIDANNLASGNQAFTLLATAGAAFTGVRGQLAYAFSDLAGTADDRTIVSGDVNGDRVADFQIEVNGLISFGTGDFLL